MMFSIICKDRKKMCSLSLFSRSYFRNFVFIVYNLICWNAVSQNICAFYLFYNSLTKWQGPHWSTVTADKQTNRLQADKHTHTHKVTDTNRKKWRHGDVQKGRQTYCHTQSVFRRRRRWDRNVDKQAYWWRNRQTDTRRNRRTYTDKDSEADNHSCSCRHNLWTMTGSLVVVTTPDQSSTVAGWKWTNLTERA